MLPHGGQGANQAIEDGVALATVLARPTAPSAPRALLVYERCGGSAPPAFNATPASTAPATTGQRDLDRPDRQLAAQPQERAWIWDYDAEAEASAAAASL